MSLNHILLGLLRDPATGYDLKNAFSQSARHFWSAELSQIYPTLKRLEQRGLLRSRVEPSPKGPNRKVYWLTDEGRAELLRWLHAGPAVGTERFAYLAQLYFMDALGRPSRNPGVHDGAPGEPGPLAGATPGGGARGCRRPRRCSGALQRRWFPPLRGACEWASIPSDAKVAWCDETLAAIDRRLAVTPARRKPAASEPNRRKNEGEPVMTTISGLGTSMFLFVAHVATGFVGLAAFWIPDLRA